MIAATALSALAATEPSWGQDGSLVLNNQLQLGDVIGGQTLNVEGASDQVTVSNSVQGNALSGSVEGQSISLGSRQVMRGDARATTDLGLGSIEGPVNAVTQASGNYLAAGAAQAGVGLAVDQVTDAGEITAGSGLRGGEARLLGGGSISTAAGANVVAVGGDHASFEGEIDQTSRASVRASNLAEIRYAPEPFEVTSQAAGNALEANGRTASSLDLAVRQRQSAGVIEADASANAANAWDAAGHANAAANQAVLYDSGGSLVASTDQGNGSDVSSRSVVTAYDYGVGTSLAQASGNAVSAGSDDVYVELDNTQMNSGGVEAQASFVGTQGYDAYVSADAVGNTVTGYACSECAATLTANNVQINSGAITAGAYTTIHGGSRAVITGTQAIGNNATFYVSRPCATDTCH